MLAVMAASSPEGKEDKIFAYLKLGADAGDPQAQNELGKWYMHRTLTDSTSKTACGYIQRAAQWGLPEAQYLFSDCLATGKGTAADAIAAVVWCKKAAQQHFPFAERVLAQAYLGASHHYGIQPNPVDGMQWLMRAAKDGDHDAQFLLGLARLEGLGVEKDTRISRELLAAAAKNGDVDAAVVLKLLSQETPADAPNKDTGK
jgi:TPR repeat protein